VTDFDPTGHGGICAVGRQLAGGPALDVFLTGGAAGLWRSWYAPTGWLTNRAGALILRPVDVAGSDQRFPHQPAAVAWASDRLDVFAVNASGDLWHFWSVGQDQPLATWGGESLGQPHSGALDSAPSAVSQGVDKVTVFVRSGTNGALTACVWDPAAGERWEWHNAHSLGWPVQPTPYAFAPAATSWGADRIDLFGATGSPQVEEGTGAVLAHTWQQEFPGNPAWHPDHWEELPNAWVTSNPVAVSWTGPQRIFVAYCAPTTIAGTSVAMSRWLDTRWGHLTLYSQLSGSDGIAGYPALTSWAKDRLDVFWLRSDSHLQHGWNNTGGHLPDWQWENFLLARA
jgi:hypothetical protein